MTFNESIEYLYGLGHETLAMKFGLRNTEILLEALENPQQDFFKVQIAGTNGKGSVCAFLEEICRAANIKTGVFTSPHLVSITERISVQSPKSKVQSPKSQLVQGSRFKVQSSGNENFITDEIFALLTDEVRNAVKLLIEQGKLDSSPTFFEHLTAIALKHFAESSVDLAILETGLGGRLDSTTAAKSEIAAITKISIDHQEYLGETLREIAAEKAAIINENTLAAVFAEQTQEVTEIIEKRFRDFELEPKFNACDYRIIKTTDDGKFIATFQTESDIYENVVVNLRGEHQLDNACLAINIAENLREFGFDTSKTAIIEGLQTAIHKGRLEIWENVSPRILFDGAHNIDGAKALSQFLQQFIKTPVTLIFGAMRDKDLTEITSELFPLVENLILTEVDNPRSADLETLKSLVPQHFDANRLYFAKTVKDALRIARNITSPENLIVVTGSLYLIGEAQTILSE
ncbi:MAG: hypothetical protein H7Z37_14585 [Pyrinomonadaceae bacterium]|nr:hypothetical protein [Pyrinomonadaceae bacterium]